jgi:hypothetical protein
MNTKSDERTLYRFKYLDTCRWFARWGYYHGDLLLETPHPEFGKVQHSMYTLPDKIRAIWR